MAFVEFPFVTSQSCEGGGFHFARAYYSIHHIKAERSPLISLGREYEGYQEVLDRIRYGDPSIRKIGVIAVAKLCDGEAHGGIQQLEGVENIIFTMPNPELLRIRPPDADVRFHEDIGRARALVEGVSDRHQPPPYEPVVFPPYSLSDRIEHPYNFVVPALAARLDQSLYAATCGLETLVEMTGEL